MAILASCGGGVEYALDPKTHRITSVRHFSSEKEIIYHSIDSALADEMQHRRPSGGVKTWREYWQNSISAWRQYKNFEYENYLYRRRRELGLKELERL